MDESNLYPLDGAAFKTEPEEQTDEAKLEVAKAQSAGPILRDIIERFRQKIDFYNSVDSIPAEVKTNPQQFLIIHNANELTRDNLIAEVEWLEGLLEEQR